MPYPILKGGRPSPGSAVRLSKKPKNLYNGKEGHVKIYSEQEIRFMFEKHFINVQWEQVGKTACIAWGKNLPFE